MDALVNSKKRNKKTLLFVLLSVLICTVSGIAFFFDSVNKNLDVTIGNAEAVDYDYKISGSINNNTEITVDSPDEEILISITEENTDSRDLFRNAVMIAKWNKGTDIRRATFQDNNGTALTDITYDEKNNQIMIPLSDGEKIAAGKTVNHYIEVVLDAPTGGGDSIADDTLTFAVQSDISLIKDSWAETVGPVELKLHTNFVQAKYTVKFHPNGGTGSMNDQEFVYGTAQNLSANTFTRTNYTFEGWATSENGSVRYTDKQSVNNLTSVDGGIVNLYAVWDIDGYTVTYDANGGTFDNTLSKNDVVYQISERKSITKISKTSNVSDDGLTADTSIGYGNNKKTIESITIPGADSLEVTITSQTENTYYDWVAIYDESITPTQSNYNKSISGKLGGSTKTTKTFTVSGDTVQFYFNSNSSRCGYYGYYATVTGVGVDITALSGDYKEPFSDAFLFDGWYTDKACTEGNEFKLEKVVPYLSSDIIVYAKWKEPPVPIIQKWSSGATTDFHKHKSTISEVVFLQEYHLPEGFDTTKGYGPWDVSAAKDNSVMAYMVGTKVYICANTLGSSNIFANTDSSNIFSSFSKLVTVTNTDFFDLSTATTMKGMFYDCRLLTSIDVSNWDLSSVTNMSQLFYYCYNIENIDVSKWDVSSVKDMSSLFNICRKVTYLDVSNWDVSNVEDMSNLFAENEALPSIDVSKWDVSNVKKMGNMFNRCETLTKIDVSNWDTSKVTAMNLMFYGCSSLTDLDVSNWDTSSLTTMYYMFYNCEKLNNLDVSNWNTSNVTTMAFAFDKCRLLSSLDVSNWNTKNVTTMQNMFYSCNSLTALDVSDWNTANVTTMESMFDWCASLKTLDVSKWNTSKVTSMKYMFHFCTNLKTLNPANWDTSKVKDMYFLFGNCENLMSLDLRNWNTSAATNMYGILYDCQSVTAVYVGDGWTTDVQDNYSDIFQDNPIDYVTYVGDDYYTVNFAPNGGEGTMNSIQVLRKWDKNTFNPAIQPQLTANTFTKDGYTFAGWSTTADGAQSIANGASGDAIRTLAGKGETITLYAVWIANTSTVNFDVNSSDTINN